MHSWFPAHWLRIDESDRADPVRYRQALEVLDDAIRLDTFILRRSPEEAARGAMRALGWPDFGERARNVSEAYRLMHGERAADRFETALNQAMALKGEPPLWWQP